MSWDRWDWGNSGGDLRLFMRAAATAAVGIITVTPAAIGTAIVTAVDNCNSSWIYYATTTAT